MAWCRRKPAAAALVATTLAMVGLAIDRLSLGADAHARIVVLSDLHQERQGQVATIRRKGCEPATAVAERTSDVMMTFVRLPKGTFYTGWNGTPRSAKKTEIEEDFEIAMHDVTQGQWQAVMGENPSYFSRFGGGSAESKQEIPEIFLAAGAPGR
jgi:formylglycine-generating enzyme required for sulfatase activity